MYENFLGANIENARLSIGRMTKKNAENPDHVLADEICHFYRQRGASAFLMYSDYELFFDCLHRSVSLYLFNLKQVPEDEKRMSEAEPIFDAILSNFDTAVVEIAKHARTTHNSDYEYEEDFLYIHFILSYFYRKESMQKNDCKAILDEFNDILNGGEDIHYDLCLAFLEKNEAAFTKSFKQFLKQTAEKIENNFSNGSLWEGDYAWSRKISVEALALIKLAEKLGFKTEEEYDLTYCALQTPPATKYDVDYWKKTQIERKYPY